MDRPHPYQNGCDLSIGANPRRFFGSFLIAQKATRRRGGEIPPTKRRGAKPAGGQAPPLQIPKGVNGTGGSGTRPYGGAVRSIRHCEEVHRPDVAIRFPAKKETDSHGPSGASE